MGATELSQKAGDMAELHLLTGGQMQKRQMGDSVLTQRQSRTWTEQGNLT